MWPFEDAQPAGRLAAIAPGETGPVALLATVVSVNDVQSPVTGERSALARIELLERLVAPAEDYVVLGAARLGNVLVLQDRAGDELRVVAGRAHFQSATQAVGQPISDVPAELAPYLRYASGREVICYRELLLRTGDKVLVKAVVESTNSVVADGYRSGTKISYVARDDLSLVVLEEVVDIPDW